MSELSDRLEKMPLTHKATHIALAVEQSGVTQWAHDVWNVELTFEGRSLNTQYRTGLGHRKLVSFGRAWRDGEQYGSNEIPTVRGALAAARAGLLIPPKTVPVADVLYSLLSDASGTVEETFESWCASYGNDTDSRKALDTYLACQATYGQLVRLFGSRELVGELAALEH